MQEVTEMYGKIEQVVYEVENMALHHAHKRPAMTTLVEEMAEAVLAARGKHDDPLELELMQVASVAVNLIAQLRMGREGHVRNLRTTAVDPPTPQSDVRVDGTDLVE